jgi:hypothetical protein
VDPLAEFDQVICTTFGGLVEDRGLFSVRRTLDEIVDPPIARITLEGFGPKNAEPLSAGVFDYERENAFNKRGGQNQNAYGHPGRFE